MNKDFTIRILIYCLVMLIFIHRAGRASEIDEIIGQITGYPSKSDSSTLIPIIDRLLLQAKPYSDSLEQFISPGTMESIERQTKEDRLEVYKALFPILNSKNLLLRGTTAAVLAFYHYHPAGERLLYFPDERMKAVLYSILEYKNGSEWAMNHYNRYDAKRGIDADSIYQNKLAAVTLFWYLADYNCLPFLEFIKTNEKDTRILERALLAEEKVKAAFSSIR